MEKKRYGAIDGLRAIACLGIVMMHVKTNDAYAIDGFFLSKRHHLADKLCVSVHGSVGIWTVLRVL